MEDGQWACQKIVCQEEGGRCGGLVASVPACRSAHPGFESRPGASPPSGLRGGRSLCEYCTSKNKLVKLGPGWLSVEEEKKGGRIIKKVGG